MTRLESVAWTLAGGAVTVFVLSAVLKGRPWATAFLAIALAVALWSRHVPLVAGMALGVIGWLFLTGFIINGQGEIRLSGWADVIRLAVLIGIAPVVALLSRPREPRTLEAGMPAAPEELVWAEPHRLVGGDGLGTHVSSGVSDGDRPCRRPAVVTPHLGPRIRGMRNGTVR